MSFSADVVLNYSIDTSQGSEKLAMVSEQSYIFVT